jgi:hypothetical protein
VVTTNGTPGGVHVFENNGSGGFAQRSRSPFEISGDAQAVRIVDLQSDSEFGTARVDVVVCHPNLPRPFRLGRQHPGGLPDACRRADADDRQSELRCLGSQREASRGCRVAIDDSREDRHATLRPPVREALLLDGEEDRCHWDRLLPDADPEQSAVRRRPLRWPVPRHRPGWESCRELCDVPGYAVPAGLLGSRPRPNYRCYPLAGRRYW